MGQAVGVMQALIRKTVGLVEAYRIQREAAEPAPAAVAAAPSPETAGSTEPASPTEES